MLVSKIENFAMKIFDKVIIYGQEVSEESLLRNQFWYAKIGSKQLATIVVAIEIREQEHSDSIYSIYAIEMLRIVIFTFISFEQLSNMTLSYL